jgi:hypothetical protein
MMPKAPGGRTDLSLVVRCDNCFRELSIPKLDRKLRITCPSCKHQFFYRYNVWGISGSTKKFLLVGLVGGFVGFILVELLLGEMVFASAAYGIALGSSLGMAEGFFRSDRARLLYGLRAGAMLGAIAGILSGLVAQAFYSAALSGYPPTMAPPFYTLIVARALAWCTFGALLGAAHGIKENTWGDVKYGLIGGAVGGVIGGLMFDPIAVLLPLGEGTASRLVGFVALGVAVAISVNRFREVALSRGRPEMYEQISARLPANPRLSLPGVGRTATSR